MGNTHGDFVWYELMTSDADAAQAFYGGLTGWIYENSAMESVDYRGFKAGDAPIGGFLQLTQPMVDQGARPCWVGYMQVDDVPTALAKAKASGATVLMEGGDVPGVGPFAMLHDAEGAMYYIINDQSDEASQSFASAEPKDGHCAWNELMAGDLEAAQTFYGDQFGWVVADTMDMGEAGPYVMLKNGEQSEHMLGGIMQRPPAMPVSMWTFYFRVPLIDSAAEYITSHGAEIINGPMEIPGGEFIINGIDPQGALFSVIGKKE